MVYVQHYESPLGDILLASDETALTGLWIEGGRFLPKRCLRNACSRKRMFLQKPSVGSMFTFQGKNPVLRYL